jgi:hypothetical protein
LISRCFSALKMMKADLNRLGASGAFFMRVTPPAFLALRPPPVVAAAAAGGTASAAGG